MYKLKDYWLSRSKRFNNYVTKQYILENLSWPVLIGQRLLEKANMLRGKWVGL